MRKFSHVIAVGFGTLLALLASSSANAAAAWYDGLISYSTITNCVSIIQGNPYAENGVGTYVGALQDIDGGKPTPNATYYAHVVMYGLGNACSGQRAYLEIQPPANTSIAIDAAHPVYCFATLHNVTSQLANNECPQQFVASAYGNSGAYWVQSIADPANSYTWALPQGGIWEFQIPLRSTTTLSSANLQANIHMLDGNSSPWLAPHQGVYVFGLPFSDVLTSSSFYPYISGIYSANITSGCGSGKYCPSGNVTRDQMAAFIIRAKEGEPSSSCASAPFADVPAASGFCKYIQRMATLGITTGCGGGNYCPAANVTRDQMAAFIIRTVEGEPPACTSAPFADVPASLGMCKYIKRMKDLNITTGCGAGNYCPSQVVTREQMAAFLARAFLGM